MPHLARTTTRLARICPSSSRCDVALLTEREVSDPDEVGGEWELPEAVCGGEEVPPRDEDGAAPVERRVLAAHPNRRLPRVRAQAASGIGEHMALR